MKMYKKQLQRNPLVTFRTNWGLSQQQLADLLQVCRSNISMIESGRRAVPPALLIQVARLELALHGGAGQVQENFAGSAAENAFKNFIARLSAQEASCTSKAGQLRLRLQEMQAQYRKSRAWLLLLSVQDKAGTSCTKQETAATALLEKCSIPCQQLLQQRIALQDELAALYKKKAEQCSQLTAVVAEQAARVL